MTLRKRYVLIGLGVLAVGGAAAGAAMAFRGWHGAGFAKRIYEKVKSELALSADQAKKVDALRDRIVAHFRAQRGHRKALFQEAKAVLLSDSLDDAKLGALEAKIRERRNAAHGVIRGAIKELHGILTPAQRQKLVAMIEKFHGKLKKRWGHKHP
jgi:Spy/CpxP family protein refolding chaperone